MDNDDNNQDDVEYDDTMNGCSSVANVIQMQGYTNRKNKTLYHQSDDLNLRVVR